MSIQNYLNQIKSAVFGKDVRQSIHDAIKQCYDDASIDHDNANMEVKLARGSHDTLNERFTSVEENIKNNSEQLDNKANKNEVFTMANMGQDIKEAMTGGSVAVVGSNAITYINLVEGQVTPDKLGDEINLGITSLEIVHEGKYINDNGEISIMDGWNVRKFIVPNQCKEIILNNGEDLTLKGVINYDDKTLSIHSKELFDTKIIIPNAEILINEHVGYTDGIRSLSLKFYKKGYNSATRYSLIDSNNFLGNGLIKDNVVNTTAAFFNFARFKIKIEEDRKYVGSFSAAKGYLGCAYDKNNSYLGEISQDNGVVKYPAGTNYIIINLGVDDYIESEIIYSTTKEETKDYNLTTIINKPYNFNNEKALFVGDSITKGYINGSTITNDLNYVTLFSNSVGLTSTNLAIGGALFTKGYNEVKTILEQLDTLTLNNYNFLFIAGGTNDYGLGVPIEEFTLAVKEVCDYLKANYNKEVIFITPINRIAPSNDEKAPLDEYRSVITNYAIEYEFSVIDGKHFNFPTEKTDITNDLLEDELHPSYKGYRHYKKCLCTELC